MMLMQFILTFPDIFQVQNNRNRRKYSIILIIFTFLFQPFSFIFSTTTISKILTHFKFGVKEIDQWEERRMDRNDYINFFSGSVCLLNNLLDWKSEVNLNQYWELYLISRIFFCCLFYNQVPWTLGGMYQLIKLNESS